MESAHREPRTCDGFTLIELLIVIAIIGILAGIMLAKVERRPEAWRNVNRSNISAIERADEAYKVTTGQYVSGTVTAPKADALEMNGIPKVLDNLKGRPNWYFVIGTGAADGRVVGASDGSNDTPIGTMNVATGDFTAP